MSSHTPEPWYLYDFGPDPKPGPYIVAMTVDDSGPARGYTITCGEYNPSGGTYWPAEGVGGRSDEEARANARRIVACVNGCRGINPEAVPELVNALHLIADAHSDCGMTYCQDVARAAIAKAKGVSHV